MPTFDELVDHIDQPGIDGDPERDISRLQPGITIEEALRVQLAVKRRRAANGDRIAGHQASFTSAAIQKMFPDAPVPMVGTFLQSITRADGDEVELDAEETFIESEFGLLLKRDVEGPNVTPSEVLAATEGFMACIEVAPLRPGVRENRFSWAHAVAVQKAFGGYMVLGSRLVSPSGIDPRLEACLVSLDGEAKAAAAGFEAMGSPLKVVAAMANRLSRIGEKLSAGQVIMTGTLAPPQPVGKGVRVARVEFQNLGSVSVRFAR